MSVETLNALNFKSSVLDPCGTVLVEFYSEQNISSKMVLIDLEQIAQEHPDIIVGKVNVDKESHLTARYGIICVPTIVVFKDGGVCKRSAGVRSKHDILKML